jgi:hypothetical protein
MERSRSHSMAVMSMSELTESYEELKGKYETLWEQVDTLYKDGATLKQVETIIEKFAGHTNTRVDMLHAKMHERVDVLHSKTNDRLEVISNKLSDIVDNDIITLTKHERANYTHIREITQDLGVHISERKDWINFQFSMLHTENKRNQANFTWMCYANLIMFCILLYALFK